MFRLLLLLCSVVSMLMLCPSFVSADEGGGYLSMNLTSVSAERMKGDILFRCDVDLENATGSDIRVISNFATEFDGIDIVVTNKKGRILAQQPYVYHQSPFSPDGQAVVIKKGKSSSSLAFPIDGIDAKAKTLRVRLVGALNRSSYPNVCSTETVKVDVR